MAREDVRFSARQSFHPVYGDQPMRHLTLLCLLLVSCTAASTREQMARNADWHRRCDQYRTHVNDAWPECREHLQSEASGRPGTPQYEERQRAADEARMLERDPDEEAAKAAAIRFWGAVSVRRTVIDTVAKDEPRKGCALAAQLDYDICAGGWTGTGKRSDCKLDYSVAMRTCDEVFKEGK